MRIDGVDLAAEFSIDEIGQDCAANAALAVSRTDDGNRFGPEETLQRGGALILSIPFRSSVAFCSPNLT